MNFQNYLNELTNPKTKDFTIYVRERFFIKLPRCSPTHSYDPHVDKNKNCEIM
jgi:hypothetical protein